MTSSGKAIANPSIVFRDDFDDWAILFDPDSGESFGLNPVGVFVWKKLDGKHTVDDIVVELRENCEDVPEEAKDHVTELINDLVERGLAGYETGKA